MTPRGILTPFQRDQRQDVANGTGMTLRRAKLEQVLATEENELPWRTAFGAGLGRFRHRRSDAVLHELLRVRIRDALARWLPSERVTEIVVAADEEMLDVAVSSTDGDAAFSLRR